MKRTRSIYSFVVALSLFVLLAFIGSYAHAALTPGDTYTVVLSKVNGDGTVSEVESATAVADVDGKIDFSFSSVPTSPGTFFLVVTVEDGDGDVVRKSFVPAPPEGERGYLGANALSTTQTDMILAAMNKTGTDDPIVVAYGLILTRTPGMSDSDVDNIATLGKFAIMNGFEAFLSDNGVSASQLNLFKQKIVYNQPNKDLSNFTALFKSAVDNPDDAEDDMAMAGGLIADIFIDAALAAGIDLGLVQAAHDAAGDVVSTNPDAAAAFGELSGSTGSAIDAAMSTFFVRIGAVKVKSSYTHSLSVLDASDDQIATFNAAVAALMTTMENLDKNYAQYYSNPETITDEIKSTMNAGYQAAFETFQGAIADSNGNIAAMKANVVSANQTVNPNFTAEMLPPDFGTYRTMNGDQVNWPIPQVVAVNKVATIIIAGGSLTYDRTDMDDVMPVPGNMMWLNSEDFKGDFEPNMKRHDFDDNGTPGPGNDDDEGVENGGANGVPDDDMAMPDFFAALMGIQEDIMIAEHTRWSIFGDGQPTREEEKDAKLQYSENIGIVIERLSGTTDGETPLSDEVVEALVKMMEHPEIN